jgi:hypothetical protein
MAKKLPRVLGSFRQNRSKYLWRSFDKTVSHRKTLQKVYVKKDWATQRGAGIYGEVAEFADEAVKEEVFWESPHRVELALYTIVVPGLRFLIYHPQCLSLPGEQEQVKSGPLPLPLPLSLSLSLSLSGCVCVCVSLSLSLSLTLLSWMFLLFLIWIDTEDAKDWHSMQHVDRLDFYLFWDCGV